MGKKNANNAIDFARLFAVKARLSDQGKPHLAAPVLVENAAGATAASPSDDSVAVTEAMASPSAASIDHVQESAHRETTSNRAKSEPMPSPESATSLKLEQNDASRVQPVAASTDVFAEADDAKSTYLRIGMSRDLHARVRAFSTMNGQTPPDFVRDLFARVLPEFDSTSSMAQLAATARAAVPVIQRERRVDVRMQIPVAHDLHGRLQKFAAFRAQTLGASMLDVLEAHAPQL